MVQAETGAMVFYGLQTRQTYVVPFYCSDVAGTPVKWESGNGASATSNPYWKAPENVVLRDISIPTGLTATATINLLADSRPVNVRVYLPNHVNTIASRPQLSVGFAAGRLIGAIEGT